MAISNRKTEFSGSLTGIDFIKTLRAMSLDNAFVTESEYSSNIELYPDNRMSFVDKHVDYLVNHPSVNLQHYLSNLRLMTKVRG